jgi:hypothetical protein
VPTEAYYRAALATLSFVKTGKPTQRQFGADPDGFWEGFAGDLSAGDRLDLVIGDANAECFEQSGDRGVVSRTTLTKAKTLEDSDKTRPVPMLAGRLELVPWVKGWHNEPGAEYNGLRLGDYFEGFLKGGCGELGLTEDDPRGWCPPQRGAARKANCVSAKPRRRRQKAFEDK